MTKSLYKIISLTAVVLLCYQATHAQAPMVVNDNQTAQALVSMLAGEGVTTLNEQINCPGSANGKFVVTGTNTLGIDSGIVLSSGHVNQGINSVIGPNNGGAGPSSTTNGANFDLHLETINPTVRDVCFIEFDFVPIGDSIKFDYVFASSEYRVYSCTSYNDAFGFFISGPGITNFENIALVPGTNIPVAVNSTTGLSTGSQCASMGPGSPFSQYYNDNTNGPTISFGGFTDVFTAQAQVQACDTYHLKLAISDASDQILDTGVFLKAGSLTSIGISAAVTGTDGALAAEEHCVRGCSSAVVTLTKDIPQTQDLTIELQFGGDAINGVDYETIPSSVILPGGSTELSIEVKPLLAAAPTGPREAIIYFMSPYICHNTTQPMVVDSAVITIYDSLYAKILTPLETICQGDEITLTAEVDPVLDFTWSPEQLLEDPNELSITVSPNQNVTYKFKAWMDGAPSTCPAVEIEYPLKVDPYGNIILPDDMEVCLEDSISLNVDVLPESYDYSIKWSPAQYFRNTYDYQNMFWAPIGTHTITVEATSPNANCVSTKEMTIVVNEKDPIEYVTPTDTVIKYGETIELEAHSNANIYLWDPITYLETPTDGKTNAIPLEDMVYKVESIDAYGCRDTAYVTIKVIYESHLTIPSAFSPDGDGLNDVFKIVNNNFERLLGFTIYNRYGQEMFHTKDINQGWDGTYNGKEATIDVYYYVIEYVLPTGEQKVQKGDVTLVR